jgi:hypothetical protein
MSCLTPTMVLCLLSTQLAKACQTTNFLHEVLKSKYVPQETEIKLVVTTSFRKESVPHETETDQEVSSKSGLLARQY